MHSPLEQRKETAIAFGVKVGLHQGSVLSPLLFVTVMKKRNSAVADKPRDAFRDIIITFEKYCDLETGVRGH